MANPQVENGHVRIAYDLFEALIRAPLSGAQFAVMLAIIREVYGWSKKQKPISKETLSELANVEPRTVARAIRALQGYKMIAVKERTGHPSIFAVQKDYERWEFPTGDDRTVTPSQGDDQTVTPGGTKLSPQGGPNGHPGDDQTVTPWGDETVTPSPYIEQLIVQQTITTNLVQQGDNHQLRCLPGRKFPTRSTDLLKSCWPNVLTQLRGLTTPADYNSFISPIIPLGYGHTIVTLGVNNTFAKRRIEKRHLDQLLSVLSQCLGEAVCVNLITLDQKGPANA